MRLIIPLFPKMEECHADREFFTATTTGFPTKIFKPGKPPTSTASTNMMPIIIKGKMRVIQGKKGKDIRKRLIGIFEELWGSRPPIDHPVMINVTYAFPHKAGASKKTKAAIVPYENTPDGDNLMKNLKDAAERAGLIRNDFLFTTECVTRVRAPDQYVGIWIYISENIIIQ